MDYYKFLNSKDVEKYLRDIKYEFKPLEAAFVAYLSINAPLKAKHKAWREIIDKYPDEVLVERRWFFKEQKLSGFLENYIATQNKYIEAFFNGGDDAVYCCTREYDIYDDCWTDGSFVMYHSFEDCFKDTLRDGLCKLEITKRYIDKGYSIGLRLTPKKEIMTVNISENVSQEDWETLESFEYIFVAIPTPFKKGDIVSPIRERYWNDRGFNEKFVLTSSDNWSSKDYEANGYMLGKERKKGVIDGEWVDRKLASHLSCGDITDMLTCGYHITETGTVYWDHADIGYTYLDLVYCDGESLVRNEKILYAISNYLKGDITLELLLEAYHMLTISEHLKHQQDYHLNCFLEDGLRLAGLDEFIKKKS